MAIEIKADILGCPIIPVQAEETGAMGSAILGFAAVTGKTPMEIGETFWSCGEPVYPDPVNREIYDVRYRLYQRLRSVSREI
jgi:sugar (pentulose or hexulose) kinase